MQSLVEMKNKWQYLILTFKKLIFKIYGKTKNYFLIFKLQ